MSVASLIVERKSVFLPFGIPVPNLLCPKGCLEWRTPTKLLNLPGSTRFEDNKFLINIDVRAFKPEEISVKIVENKTILIHGKHEEKRKEGYISTRVMRAFALPEYCDKQKIKSTISPDGILTISVPQIINYKNSPGKESAVLKTKLPYIKHKL